MEALHVDYSTCDPCDIEKDDFNPDLYISQMVESSNLRQLFSKKNNLDREIQTITAEFHTLLHDNYSKFIGASEVVSTIKTNFSRMEEDMSSLQDKMDNLEATSSQILEKLQPSKDKIKKLTKRREGVHKMIILIDLVPKLRQLVEGGNYIEAVKLFLKANVFLKQYQHFQSLKGIIEESSELVTYSKLKLKERFDCSVYGNDDILEAMDSLIQLGEEQKSVLQDFFFASEKNLDLLLVEIERNFQNQPYEAIIEIGSNECNGGNSNYECNHLISNYFSTISRVIYMVRQLFANRPFVTSALETFISENIEKLLIDIRLYFKQQFGEITDEYLSSILDQLFRQCFECYMPVQRLTFSLLNAKFVLDVCKDRCEFYLKRMISELQAYLLSLKERKDVEFPRSDKALNDLVSVVENIFIASLKSLAHYVRPEHKYSRNVYFRKLFCKVLVRKGVFYSFFTNLRDSFLELTSQSNTRNRKNPHLLYLLFAKYSLELHLSRLNNFFSKADAVLHSSEENITVTPVSEISNEYKFTAQKLLDHYVQTRQAQMSHMFKKSIGNKNWLDMKEPWKVSALVRRILEIFSYTILETEPLFGCLQPTIRDVDQASLCLNTLSTSRSPSEQSSLDSGIENRIHKLFTRPTVYSKEIDFTSQSVVVSVIQMALKSLLECVRQCTFNENGLQQMQVDVFYLKMNILQCLKNEEDLVFILDEVILSCYNRTVKGEFMDPRVVSAICHTV